MSSLQDQEIKGWKSLVTINNVYIINTAVYLPNEPVNNHNIENVLGLINGKKSRAKNIVLKSNGIKQRFYTLDPNTGEPTHTNAELTAEAVRNRRPR